MFDHFQLFLFSASLQTETTVIYLLLGDYYTFSVLETTLTFTTNAKVQIIKLKVDGSVADTSGLPSCYDAGRIDLMSYKYIKNVCTPSSRCNGKESVLSLKAEVLIHQMCSSRDTCISGRFPSWDLKVLGVDAIRVEYRCLGKQTGFSTQELSGTKAYEQTSAEENSVINHHIFQNTTRFGEC